MKRKGLFTIVNSPSIILQKLNEALDQTDSRTKKLLHIKNILLCGYSSVKDGKPCLYRPRIFYYEAVKRGLLSFGKHVSFFRGT